MSEVVLPENAPAKSSSSFRLSSQRKSCDGTLTKEHSTIDHSFTFPSFKDLALTERLKEASVISLVKKRRVSRRKQKSQSLEKAELKFTDSSESDSERRISGIEILPQSDTSISDDILSPILQSPVNAESVERRSSYIRTRRKSTPHLTSTIAEDSEFDFSGSGRQFSLEHDHVTASSYTKAFSFSHQRKKSDSLVFSGIPFINPLRSREKNSKSVDDLSHSLDLNKGGRSISLSPTKSSYRDLARSKKNSVSGTSQQVSNLPPSTSDRNLGDVPESSPRNHQKRRKSSLVRHKKLSLPILWRSTDAEMMTNHTYDTPFAESSKHDPGPTDSESSKIPRMKSFDAVVFDVLRVPPEAYARQLTLLDWSHFVAITPDEISSCGWTKKDKLKRSPNVCAMTKRFNHTSFWVIHEILHASTTKIRAETLTLFIKIAKKLYELNNLHSLMAVVQSLNSSSIIRLTKTWAKQRKLYDNQLNSLQNSLFLSALVSNFWLSMLPKNHRATFDRLLSLVKEDDNRAELRSHMEDIRLPCIPFLGMYLSDVMYIDSAHPDTGGLESQERANKLNNILRVLSEFQQSKYDHLQDEAHIKKYLTSIKYIEELQKFLEEENYKLSLKIEPLPTAATINGHNRLELSSERPDMSLCRHVSHTPPSQGKFVPGHRKTKSLGREIAFNGSVSLRHKPESSKTPKRQSWYNSKAKQRDSTVWYLSPVNGFSTETVSNSGSLKRGTSPVPDVAITTSLLDDSIIATSSLTPISNRTPQANGNSGSLGSSRSNSGSEFSEQDETTSASDRNLDISSAEYQTCTFEGCLKRKCVLKQGKKPSMSSWSKYWVCICDNKLVYYAPKSFRGLEREDFKSRPCKAVSILGWMILYSNNPARLEYFQLNNPESGNMYKFQCESKEVALVWIANIEAATKGHPQPERDLINLEDA